MLEKEMYKPVKELLEGDLGCSDVYGEVALCDVVGVRGVYDVGVEMKTTLNFKVVMQALERSHLCAYMYIAVPRPRKTSHFGIYNTFLKPHGIGLIYVDDIKGQMSATAYREAKFNHSYIKYRRYNERITANIKGYEKHNVGGSKGGEVKTAYSNMISKVKAFLSDNGPATVEEIIAGVPEVSEHYKNPKQSLGATLKEDWNSHWAVRGRDFSRRCFTFDVVSPSDDNT